uniref:Protein phosphatase n=1 Tax=Oryza punctata TaxID=4537 RepID=A0A0E0K2Q6_ORYPU
MEALPQIRQTLSEIDSRIPDALRVAMGLRLRPTPALAPAALEDVTRFAASCLPQPCPEGGGDPMECDGAPAPRALRMEAASCFLPDHDEDSHFVRPEAGVIAVADGVGGYRAAGVDAAAFARALMYNAFEMVVATTPGGADICPYTLLEWAYEQAVSARTQGGSTAVLLSLAGTGTTLNYAYIGDSAFAVFRAGKLFFRSEVQVNSFNYPFQLSVKDGNSITSAARGGVEVEEGDVVVAGTDGLFDNVTNEELQRIVAMGRALGLTSKQTADVIAGFAFEASTMMNRDTPFSLESRKQQGTTFRRGKRDDITVVVAYIMEKRMETLAQIKETLRETGKLVPDIVRAAVGLEHHYQTVKLPHDGDVKGFAAAFLRLQEQAHGDGDGEVQQALRMDSASCYVPDHDEDAHFAHDGAGVVGVADGVGGYRKDGVDAGAFSRGLMTSAFAQLVTTEPGTPVCPYTLLECAHGETLESGAQGGSTAVILSLAAGNVLRWAYIGDSAFAVLRDGKVVMRSVQQQRYFNAPYYLGGHSGESMTVANVGEMKVRRGDVVVAGTDGLFDNMSDSELEKVVQIGTALGFSPKNMADIIGGTAYEMSRCIVKDSPFAVEHRKQKEKELEHFHGGKVDDITVVVACIVSSDS